MSFWGSYTQHFTWHNVFINICPPMKLHIEEDKKIKCKWWVNFSQKITLLLHELPTWWIPRSSRGRTRPAAAAVCGVRTPCTPSGHPATSPSPARQDQVLVRLDRASWMYDECDVILFTFCFFLSSQISPKHVYDSQTLTWTDTIKYR